ncbi:acyltransferase family protein [Nakamurella sp. PAMC28650]|uniref:acyltransferase family protein n=1 Tax=Nakamurella sp. PAMC28650 TaxID=2762325 RepID=UPI00164E01AC|nr:acyltransferase family protein [Nakamurella sp. PAMC28650]QNK80971.1 acyltransferase [Nakamurella sp. PAMC28650]
MTEIVAPKARNRHSLVAETRPGLLTQIQALRALAVLLVVGYHLWPTRLSGGFIGVDVFFVISGFLMTGHILRNAPGARSLGASLSDFYLRRIVRILPAALVVLVLTAILTLTLVSRVNWELYLREIVASGLYFENWSLASSSTDYLAAGAGASPVQHYWSLSVEEQFYIIWPILLLGTGLMFRARRTKAVATLLLVLIGGSLAYSVLSTAADAKFAYFDIFARLWEFGVGGALAVGIKHIKVSPPARAALSWMGLALIAWSSLVYSGDTSFPGSAASIPVLGAAAVIAGGSTSAWIGPQRLFALQPVQYLGDISYSLYLWHWPLIVLVPAVTGMALTTPAKAIVLLVAIVLAAVSKLLIEDPIRDARSGRGPVAWRAQLQRDRFVYVAGAAFMALVVVLAGSGWLSLRGPVSSARAALAATSANVPSCFGAEVMNGDSSCSAATVPLTEIVPSPLIATDDFPYERCQQRVSRSDVITCTFGSSRADAVSVALVGDSHATQWLPALIPVADANNWQLTTYLMSGCTLTATITSNACGLWNSRLSSLLPVAHLKFILVSGRSPAGNFRSSEVPGVAEGIAKAWSKLLSAGSEVIALRDIPQPDNAGKGDIPPCVYANGASPKCDFAQGPSQKFDLMGAAAALTPDAKLVDVSGSFCTAGMCSAVIGKVLVYLDDNHMTATFARSLSHSLGSALIKVGMPSAG